MVKSRKYVKKSLKMRSRHKKHPKVSKRRNTTRKIKKSRKRGGSCGRKHKKQRGGYGPGACPIGYPWNGANVDTWPGAVGNSKSITMSNHYSLSPSGGRLLPLPVATNQTNKQYGGGRLTALLPLDLVNFGRSLKSTVVSTMNSFSGVPTSASSKPLPTTQPIDVNYKYIGRKIPLPVVEIHSKAGTTVANI